MWTIFNTAMTMIKRKLTDQKNKPEEEEKKCQPEKLFPSQFNWLFKLYTKVGTKKEYTKINWICICTRASAKLKGTMFKMWTTWHKSGKKNNACERERETPEALTSWMNSCIAFSVCDSRYFKVISYKFECDWLFR